MPYESLRKLYYGDESIYTKTYVERFNSLSAIKLDLDELLNERTIENS